MQETRLDFLVFFAVACTFPLILNSPHQFFSVHSHGFTDDVVLGNFSLTSPCVQSGLTSADEFSCRRCEDTMLSTWPAVLEELLERGWEEHSLILGIDLCGSVLPPYT
jgi:hypothetical protein